MSRARAFPFYKKLIVFSRLCKTVETRTPKTGTRKCLLRERQEVEILANIKMVSACVLLMCGILKG